MNKRYWYGLRREMSPVGFGCWQIGGEHSVNGKPLGWGAVSETDAIELIHYAIDSGVQFFDTAAGYGGGRSEEILGKAIAQSNGRSNVCICTKIPLTADEVQTNRIGQSFVDRVEESLNRLRVSCVDVLLIHNPPDDLDWQHFDFRVLEELVANGKILTFGVSSRTIDGAIKVVEAGFGSCVEWVFNLLERRPVDVLFPNLKSSRFNFIARSPLSRGLLIRKYFHQQPVFDQNEFRSTLPQEWVEWVVSSIRNADLTIEEKDNLAAFAVQYCLSFEEVSVVIPGIKRAEHLDKFLSISKELNLDGDFFKRLEASTEKCFPKWN